MSSTAHIEWVRENRGQEAAFSEACSTVRRQAAEVAGWWNSRFFEVRILDDGTKKLWHTTEKSISRAYDLQDCEPDLPEFRYCDDDGLLDAVTVGRQERINTEEEWPFVFTAADIVANGKVVGQVMYMDH